MVLIWHCIYNNYIITSIVLKCKYIIASQTQDRSITCLIQCFFINGLMHAEHVSISCNKHNDSAGRGSKSTMHDEQSLPASPNKVGNTK